MARKRVGKVETPRRVCFFCGGSPCTEEHIWPQWAAPLMPWSSGHTMGYNTGFREAVTWQRWSDKQGKLWTRRVKAVCKRCNNGWMNRLEQRVREPLTKLLLGRTFVLTPSEQDALGMYFCMKAMVAEGSRRDAQVFTQAERTALFETATLPVRCSVRLFHYPARPNDLVTAYNKEHLHYPSQSDGSVIGRVEQANFTFRFNNAFIQVLLTELIPAFASSSRFEIRLHPRTGFSRAWPLLPLREEYAHGIQHHLEVLHKDRLQEAQLPTP